MCGRIAQRTPLQNVIELFSLVPTPWGNTWTTRFNIAPSQNVPAVRNDAGKRTLGLLHWGLIPSWAKADFKVKPINARAEGIATNRLFRDSFKRRRCLIPADGFFEWKGSKAPKQPYFIHHPDDRVFAFAGIWEQWKPGPDIEPVETCAIITTTPNDVMQPIHNRMPVILGKDDYNAWLSEQTPDAELQALLKPYDGALEAYPVSTLVNKPTNEGPDVIRREVALFDAPL